MMGFPAITKDEFIALWRGLFPRSYTRPIEEDPQGFDIVSAYAAIFARVAESTNSTAQRLYIRPHSSQTGEPATGGVRASGTLRASNGGALPVVIVTGQVVRDVYRDSYGTTRMGDSYAVTADTAIPVSGTVDLPVRALRVGEHGNVKAESITAFELFGRLELDAPTIGAGALRTVTITTEEDLFSADLIGRYLTFTGGALAGLTRRITGVISETSAIVDADLPAGSATSATLLEFEDLGITLAQPDALTDGRDPWLDGLGAERSVLRQSGEDDATYARRILTIDDTITPNAILRAVQRVLSPLGIGFTLCEARDPGPTGLGGAAADVTASDVDTMDAPGFPPDVLAYSMACGARRFFVIKVDQSGAGEFGNAAGDLPQPPNVPQPGASDFAIPDGFPSDYFAAIAALYEQVDRTRADGVCFEIERVTP